MKSTLMAMALASLLSVGIFFGTEYIAVDTLRAQKNGWSGKLIMRFGDLPEEEKIYKWDFVQQELFKVEP